MDVGILGKRAVPSDVFFSLQQDLEDSDIPYIVEAVDLSQVGKNFKSKALAQAVPLSRLEEALDEESANRVFSQLPAFVSSVKDLIASLNNAK